MIYKIITKIYKILTNSKPFWQEGEPDQLPEKLKKITGKNLKLTISLNDKNLIHGNTVYFASDVVEDFQTSEFSQNSGILKHNVDFVEVGVYLTYTSKSPMKYNYPVD